MMHRIYAFVFCVAISGCSNEDIDPPKGSSADSPDTSAEHKDFSSEVKQREDEFLAFAATHAAIPISPEKWSSVITAKLQNEFQGKEVAVRGAFKDLVKMNDDVWVMKLGFGGYPPNSEIRVAMTKEQGSQLLKEIEKRRTMYVVSKVIKIIPHNLTATICQEPDCDEVEISENSFGKAFRIDSKLLQYRFVQ